MVEFSISVIVAVIITAMSASTTIPKSTAGQRKQMINVMPKADLRPLAELFRAHVLKTLNEEGLIDNTFIKMIMKRRHTSGFSVLNEVRIKPDDSKGIEKLSQYIIRNSFSLEK